MVDNQSRNFLFLFFYFILLQVRTMFWEKMNIKYDLVEVATVNKFKRQCTKSKFIHFINCVQIKKKKKKLPIRLYDSKSSNYVKLLCHPTMLHDFQLSDCVI